MAGLEALTEIELLDFSDNLALESVEALAHLERVGRFFLLGSRALESVGWLIGLWSVLLAFLVSALLSAYLMASTRAATPPAPPIDFNADEPDAYARDITRDETAS